MDICMDTLSVMEHELNKAYSEYDSFVEFCEQFEGDEIPDDLYSVAQEVYGADTAKTVGKALIKLAKKIWEWIVKILKFIEDSVVNYFKNMKFSNRKLIKMQRMLKDKLASDRERYDSQLKEMSRHIPDKDTFQTLQANLAILFKSNNDLVNILMGDNTISSGLDRALSELKCKLMITSVSQAGPSQEERKLYITASPSGTVEFDRDIYESTIREWFSMKHNYDWTTYDLEEAITKVMTTNRMAINIPIKRMTATARMEAKKIQDEVMANPDDPENNAKLIVSRGLVETVMKYTQLEITVAKVLNNMISQMGAYLVSGTLDLNDADLRHRNANTDSDKRFNFYFFSPLSRG